MSALTDGALLAGGANAQAIAQKAEAALAANATFLALASPTQAQAVAQVQALTRQVNGLIRFLAGEFDTTSGT